LLWTCWWELEGSLSPGRPTTMDLWCKEEGEFFEINHAFMTLTYMNDDDFRTRK
jgi:hypothetical protein